MRPLIPKIQLIKIGCQSLTQLMKIVPTITLHTDKIS